MDSSIQSLFLHTSHTPLALKVSFGCILWCIVTIYLSPSKVSMPVSSREMLELVIIK